MDLKLLNVRLAFPVLWTPKDYNNNGKLRYSANFLIPPGSPQDTMIREAIAAEIAAKFPDPAKATAFRINVEGQKNGWCYMSGDRKTYEGYAGMMVLSAHQQASKGRPLIIDANKAALTEVDGRPYGGCRVNAKISIYVQTTGDSQGVRCSFNGIQFAGHDTPFTGGTPATVDDFDDCSEGAAASAMPGVAAPGPVNIAPVNIAPTPAPAAVYAEPVIPAARSNSDFI